MPVTCLSEPAPRAIFEGRCVAEEADALLDWLRRTPEPEADLAGCTDLHTALAQLLLASSARIVAPPPDAILAACLAAAGGVRMPEPEAGSPAPPATAPESNRSRPRRRGKISQVDP